MASSRALRLCRKELFCRPSKYQWRNFMGHDLHDEMLNEDAINITEYDDGGYVLNNVDYRGSVLVFPTVGLLWKPKTIEEITKDSLELVTLLSPRIDLLLVGTGKRMGRSLNPGVVDYLKTHGIVTELMDSVNACATFNILNAESRRVAAAILTCPEE